MKRFIIKLVIFIIVILSVLALVNHRWVHTQVYALGGEIYRFEDVPDSIDVCNLGSSHAQFAISYNSLEDYIGFNFAIPAQSFVYDLHVLKQYHKYLAEKCIVIIPISYFDYYEDYEKESVLIRERRFYYPILDLWNLENLDFKSLLLHRWFPILNIKPDEIPYLLHDDFQAIAKYEKQYQKNKYDMGNENINLEGFLSENDINVYGHAKDFMKGVNPYGVERLEEIIVYCKEHNYRPLLLTTPFTSYYNDAEDFTEAFYAEFYTTTETLADRYNIDYWDYSHDPRFVDDITLFYDNNHLNQGKGKMLFSNILLKRLSDEGYLE